MKKILIITLAVLSQCPVQVQTKAPDTLELLKPLEPKYDALAAAAKGLNQKELEALFEIVATPLSVKQIGDVLTLRTVIPAIRARITAGKTQNSYNGFEEADKLYNALATAFNDSQFVPQNVKAKASTINSEEKADKFKELCRTYLTPKEMDVLTKVFTNKTPQTIIQHIIGNQTSILEKLPEAIKGQVKALILDIQGIFATLSPGLLS